MAAPSEVTTDERITRQLATTIVAIEFEEIALGDFAKFLTNFTTLPVTLDTDGLSAVGMTAEEKLEFSLRGVTVEQLLVAALDPVGLTFVPVAGQLVIRPNELATDEFITREYDISDLALDIAVLSDTAKMIEDLLAADHWAADHSSEAGVVGAIELNDQLLEVEQSRSVQFEVARLLDRLRTARGLLVRSDLPAELLQIAPVFEQAAADLDLSVSVTFAQPTPLRKMVEYVQSQTDLRVLVNWLALADIGIEPDTTTTFSISDVSLGEMLGSWLAPMQLAYRVIDARTIEISTVVAIRKHNEIEFYRVQLRDDSEAQALISELAELIGAPFFQAGNSQGAIAYDQPSGCLLVALPQPQQRKVASWLETHEKRLPMSSSDDAL